MRLSKSDALFLHKILFHYTLSAPNFDSLAPGDIDTLEAIVQELRSFILNDVDGISSSESPQHDANVETEDSQDSDEFEDPDAEVSADDLEGLKPMFVTTPTGQKASLEFEAIGDGVDALIDGGSLIIDEVTHLRVHPDAIELYSGDEWHEFPFKKIPKDWVALLEKEKLYEITASLGSSDDESE